MTLDAGRRSRRVFDIASVQAAATLDNRTGRVRQVPEPVFAPAVYTFTDTTGLQYVFPPSGQLNYEQDTNGNRITLGYNSQNQHRHVTTYSNPSDSSEPSEQLTLSYNAQGFVSQVADGTGDDWTYTYDSTGHLRLRVRPRAA